MISGSGEKRGGVVILYSCGRSPSPINRPKAGATDLWNKHDCVALD